MITAYKNYPQHGLCMSTKSFNKTVIKNCRKYLLLILPSDACVYIHTCMYKAHTVDV